MQQFLIRSLFHNPSLLQIKDPVTVPDRGQTMRNNETRAFHLLQRIHHTPLRLVV